MKTADCPQKKSLFQGQRSYLVDFAHRVHPKIVHGSIHCLCVAKGFENVLSFQAKLENQQPAKIWARHRSWGGGGLQDRHVCGPARRDDETFCCPQEQPGKASGVESWSCNEMMESRSHLLRANPGTEQPSWIEATGFSSSSSQNVLMIGSNMIGPKGNQGFESGWKHFGNKRLIFLITQLTPRRATWAHRLARIYQSSNVTQCHPVPERPLPA